VNRIRCVPMHLIGIVLLLGLAVACTATSPAPQTTVPTIAISSESAIQLAIQGCRKPHLVLVGEPEAIKATLMSLAEADQIVSEKGEHTSYSQPTNTTVWLVQIDGLFQRVGGPRLASGSEPTPSPLWTGACLVIVDANKGDVLVIRNLTK